MRTEVVTIDASCVAKLFLEEADSAEFRTWYRAMQGHGVQFRAPHLLVYELGNVIGDEFFDVDEHTRVRILESALTGIQLQDTDPGQPFRFMGKPKLTYYDAAYVADGFDSGSIASADERMRKAAANTGNMTRIWTPELQRAAAAPGFVAWLRDQDGQDPAGDVSRGIRADPLAKNLDTYLDAWRHMEGRRVPHAALEALDRALATYVVSSKD